MAGEPYSTCLRPDKLQDRASQARLAAATLTNQTERLSGINLERNLVYRGQRAVSAQKEAYFEVFNRKERIEFPLFRNNQRFCSAHRFGSDTFTAEARRARSKES